MVYGPELILNRGTGFLGWDSFWPPQVLSQREDRLRMKYVDGLKEGGGEFFYESGGKGWWRPFQERDCNRRTSFEPPKRSNC